MNESGLKANPAAQASSVAIVSPDAMVKTIQVPAQSVSD
jgi:hypothetical protein